MIAGTGISRVNIGGNTEGAGEGARSGGNRGNMSSLSAGGGRGGGGGGGVRIQAGFCKKCREAKPARAHHCHVCDQCIVNVRTFFLFVYFFVK